MTHPQADAPLRFRKQQRINAYTLVVVSFITLSSAAYGYAGSMIATTLTQPSFQEQMALNSASNANALISAVNGLFYAGGACGSFLAGWTSDKYGRKFSAALGNLILLISGTLLTASVNIAMFIAFRFFSGVGAFQILASVPLWVAELAPPKLRGVLTDIHAVAMMTGYTLACYVGLGFYFVPGNDQWRGPIGIQMHLPTVILTGIYWMPESPRYLISKSYVDRASSIVHRMHSNTNDANDDFARREFYQMRKQIELDSTFATSFAGIFTKKSLRKRALMTIFLEFCLMSSGVLVILNYGSMIWRSLGFDTVQILHFQGGFQLTGLVFNVVAMTFVDRIKRNWLITIGFMTCAIVMSCEAALQRYFLNTTDRGGLIACAFMIFLFQTLFSLFLDGPTCFYIVEIWPSYVRSQGFAIAMATHSLTNLIWLETAPTAFDSVGWKFYLCFIVIPIIGGAVVFLFYHDTLHKTLEEIAAMFGDEDEVVIYQRDLDSAYIPREMEDPSPDKEAKQVETLEAVEAV